MREDRFELFVVGRVDALLIPVDGFELLHQGHDCTMKVERFFREILFVQGVAGHGSTLSNPQAG